MFPVDSPVANLLVVHLRWAEITTHRFNISVNCHRRFYSYNYSYSFLLASRDHQHTALCSLEIREAGDSLRYDFIYVLKYVFIHRFNYNIDSIIMFQLPTRGREARGEVGRGGVENVAMCLKTDSMKNIVISTNSQLYENEFHFHSTISSN